MTTGLVLAMIAAGAVGALVLVIRAAARSGRTSSSVGSAHSRRRGAHAENDGMDSAVMSAVLLSGFDSGGHGPRHPHHNDHKGADQSGAPDSGQGHHSHDASHADGGGGGGEGGGGGGDGGGGGGGGGGGDGGGGGGD